MIDMKIALVKKEDNSFVPAFDSDYEKVMKLKNLKMVQCEIKQPRNYEFHKKYFALINMLFSNQELYTNIDHLREDLTIEAGYYTTYISIHGEVIKRAKSISFSSMEEYEFSELYNRTIDVIVKYFHFDKELIINNVEQWF